MKIVYQKRWNECAIACIKMILDKMHKDVTYEEIKKLLNGQKTLYDIRLLLGHFNLKSKSFYNETKILKTIENTYTILNFKFAFFKHFVVLVKNEDEYFIFDPKYGRKQIKNPQRKYKIWTGFGLIIESK